MKKPYGIVVLLIVALIVLPACGLVDLANQDLPLEPDAPSVVERDGQEPEVAIEDQPRGEPADLIVLAQPTATPEVIAPEGAAGVMAAYEGTLQQVYADVSPSVVNIQVLAEATLPQSHPDVPGYPFGPQSPDEPQLQSGLGSGFVWDNEGHIVTNNHVVEGARQVAVTFFDGTTVTAEVIGTDPESDLAVLLIDVPAEMLRPLPLANSLDVRVGELAIAIGNPFGLSGTMTVGIISATGRSLPVQSGDFTTPQYTIPDIIQTDAPINPGNSGGALVDEQGRLIGVTAAIESPVRANAGIGFAIPAVIVERVVPALIETGTFQHPWLGIQGNTLTRGMAEAMNLDPRQRGALVVDVVPGGPASQAGLRGSDREMDLQGFPVRVGGDVIIGIDGQPVLNFEDIVTYLARQAEVGQTITLTIIRDGEQQTLDVTLTARPGSGLVQPPESQQPGGTGTAWLGITGTQVTPDLAQAMNLPADLTGVLIEQVDGDSPAENAGLQGGSEAVTINGQEVLVGGDIIVGFDGQPVATLDDLGSYLGAAQPGELVTLTIVRDGQLGDVAVELGERPGVSVP